PSTWSVTGCGSTWTRAFATPGNGQGVRAASPRTPGALPHLTVLHGLQELEASRPPGLRAAPVPVDGRVAQVARAQRRVVGEPAPRFETEEDERRGLVAPGQPGQDEAQPISNVGARGLASS